MKTQAAWGSRSLLMGVLTLLLGIRPTTAETGSASLPVLTIDKEILLVPEPAAGPSRIDPGAVTVTVAGQGQKIVSSGPVNTWKTVIYLDPALATPDGIRAATASLAAAAPALVDFGPVSIVVADPFTDSYLEESREAEEIQSVLEELEGLADAAGEIVAIRQELAEDLADLDAESRQLALQEEFEIQQESQLELMRWLSQQNAPGPHLLILVEDGYDLTNLPPEMTEPHERVSRTLAVAGWTVLPLVPDSSDAELLPGRLETMQALASDSGGMVIDSSLEIRQALRSLESAISVRVRLSGIPDGIPRPLEVGSSQKGVRFRAPKWSTVSAPIALTEIRALQTLEEPDLAVGPWSTSGILRPDPEAPPSAQGFAALLEAMTELRGEAIPDEPVLRISLLLFQAEGPPQIAHDLAAPTDLSEAEAWLYRKRLTVSENLAAAAVVVEELVSGQWGSAPLELSDRALPTEGRQIAIWDAPDLIRTPPSGVTASAPEEEDVVIRVLPPKKRPAVDQTRFETLVSSPIVDKVTFSLDGEQVATDDRAPFSATLDLGPEVDMHQIKVEAYTASGARLGSHQITVNPRDDSFLVRIVDIANPLGGIQTVTAEVRVPRDAQLDRVEFYWNDTLVETLRQAPFQIELPVPDAGAQAFVRVAAYLEDGTWIDDAQLLGDTAISERVQVNLVELHVMVTDRDNKPIEGLGPEDFTVKLGREEQKIERLGFAEDVPLVLGVVIDTSESMWPLMVETQKAGAQFVANTLTEGDSAFLVDFDTQPRLAQQTTTDVMTLLRTFSRFQPDGLTALYDAIIFSMLQFEEAEGRKALVLLSDGDDVKSRYGPRRCIQFGKRLGVPVYIISLAGVHNSRRNLRRIDLEGITEGTGGQVFYITEMSELAEAYSTINRELRSQYILTFSVDRELTELELEDVEVSVAGKGLSVRGVVGGQQVQ
jgi:VWFA-related protein